MEQTTFSFLHGQVLVAHLPRQLYVRPVANHENQRCPEAVKIGGVNIFLGVSAIFVEGNSEKVENFLKIQKVFSKILQIVEQKKRNFSRLGVAPQPRLEHPWREYTCCLITHFSR